MHRNHLLVDNYLDTPSMSAKLSTCLTPGVRSNRIAGPVGLAQALCLVLLASLLSNLTVAHANETDVTQMKLYAKSLLSHNEYISLSKLIIKESNWNPRAKSGDHYGLCQGRSDFMRTATYKQQIRWCIIYSYHRYGSVTGAWLHWRRYSWQ